MPRSNVLSGGAFVASLFSLGIFILMLLLLGTLLYRAVGNAMEKDLEEQLVEESLLFQQIYDDNGREALISAVKQLETPAVAANRLVGLYSKGGYKLAGNFTIGPGYVGLLTRDINQRLELPRGKFWFYAHDMSVQEPVTVVVGREADYINRIRHLLLVGLILAGCVVTVTSVGGGYIVSKRMFGKLVMVSSVLEETSRGNMHQRISIGSSNDQIDRISQRINQHLDRLSLLTQATKNTINSIAHDLRSPLNRVFIRIQEVTADTDDVCLQKSLDDVSTELLNIIDSFEAILRISRIEAQSDNDSFEIYSVEALLDEMDATFAPVVESSGKILVSHISQSPAKWLYGDIRMLQQMMANLIQNAIHHCPEATRITISAATDAEGHTILHVADNGPGIPVECREDVLKPFYRLDSSRATPGTGLGLTLVNVIAIRHRAILTLSDNNPGLLVSVIFPTLADHRANLTKN